jgi:hypothetical protein
MITMIKMNGVNWTSMLLAPPGPPKPNCAYTVLMISIAPPGSALKRAGRT